MWLYHKRQDEFLQAPRTNTHRDPNNAVKERISMHPASIAQESDHVTEQYTIRLLSFKEDAERCDVLQNSALDRTRWVEQKGDVSYCMRDWISCEPASQVRSRRESSLSSSVNLKVPCIVME